jgi:two-component system, OmpR family, sensor kinase
VIAAELVLAVWPLGLGVAAAIAGAGVRRARRREALNRALHELRRPLHTLVLSSGAGPGPGSHALRVALAALDDLDCEINRGRRRIELRPVDCRALVQPAVERWRGVAAATRRALTLRWRAGSATVMADPDRVAQALDNLIDNALRHGGLRVCVSADVGANGVRITVHDTGASTAARDPSDPRHGHGLPVVKRVAAEHGGRFLLSRTGAGTTATLELPLAPRTIAAAERALADAAAVESGSPSAPPVRAAA